MSSSKRSDTSGLSLKSFEAATSSIPEAKFANDTVGLVPHAAFVNSRAKAAEHTAKLQQQEKQQKKESLDRQRINDKRRREALLKKRQAKLTFGSDDEEDDDDDEAGLGAPGYTMMNGIRVTAVFTTRSPGSTLLLSCLMMYPPR
mmetsp:Transcript_11590/g.26217  ORF Transcript_11590/g.26217 Transcript_11590/m.26217 type:complete len:145 (+) Transcript_11590:170-604(+)